MKSVRSSAFKKLFESLPAEIRTQAYKQYELWKQDPNHPSLHFKPIKGGEGWWSARVSRQYRAICMVKDNTAVWFWIGHHSDYDELLK